MSMTAPEARQEIKNLFEQAEQIENRYPDPAEMPNEERDQVKNLLSEIDGLEANLATLESAEQRKTRILEGLERYSKPAPGSYRPGAKRAELQRNRAQSPGQHFISNRDYREMRQAGEFKSQVNKVAFSVNLPDGVSLIQWARQARDQKTLLYGSSDSSGGAFVPEQMLPGYLEILQRGIDVLDLVPRMQTESDTIEYVREDTFTNNAAMVAEATATTGTSGLKPESALAYSKQTSTVRTLAHWIPVTNRMLDDAPAIAGYIDNRLLVGLNLELEDQVLTGDGSGENFTGLLETAGINIQGVGSDNALDAIFKARTQVRVNGKGRPGAVVLHPNDWQAIRLTRENASTGTLGQYLMGPPSQVGAVTVWGIPIVESEGITENTGLIGDFQMGAAIFDREQAAVRVGTIDDQFVRNMQTLLAELRAAFVVFRPAVFTKITGI